MSVEAVMERCNEFLNQFGCIYYRNDSDKQEPVLKKCKETGCWNKTKSTHGYCRQHRSLVKIERGKKCCAEGCNTLTRGKYGLCTKHYKQYWEHKSRGSEKFLVSMTNKSS